MKNKNEEKIEYTQSISQNIFINKADILDFICPLCNGVLFNPTQDSCGHVFCNICYEKCKENYHKCPISNNDFIEEKITNIPIISQIINKMNVYCLNKDKNCFWEGKFSELKSHLEIECLKEEIKCIFKGCEKKMKREDFLIHKSECEYRTITCIFCNELIPFKFKESHDNICPKKIIKCDKCGNDIVREDLENHKKNSCDCTFTDCLFKDFGCNDYLMRKDFNKNMVNDLPKHLSLICDFIKKENQKYKKIINDKEKIEEELKEEIKYLRNEIINMKETYLNNKRFRSLKEEEYTIFNINNIYDKKHLPKEIIIENGKAINRDKNLNHSFCFANPHYDINLQGSTLEYNWRILLCNCSNWIGFGVCDKPKVINNNYIFKKKDHNYNNGSYIVSSNGYMFNCNNNNENCKKINFPSYDESHEFNLKYNVLKKELTIYSNIQIIATFSKVESFINNKLTPVIVFINQNDSAMFLFN